MMNYFHSVRLESDKCQGCVTCIKRCPTEAIRVRRGKALIRESNCIDCGECIRYCPVQAKKAVTDSLDGFSQYKHNIALPAPALYSQFPLDVSIEMILAGLMELGFDDVFEVAAGAEIVSLATRDFLNSGNNHIKPLISSACPAVVRLIQIKFPELIEHLSPFDAPTEVAARIARAEAVQKLGLPAEDIGTWFITPCPAKMTAVRSPLGSEKSHVSGAIGINQVYGKLRKIVSNLSSDKINLIKARASSMGLGWAASGGEAAAVQVENTLVTSDMHNVIDLFEQVSLGKLKNLDHIEALICAGGCVGGALLVENRHVAEYRLKQRIKRKTASEPLNEETVRQNYLEKTLETLGVAERLPIEPKSILTLDGDISKAIQKLDNVAKTLKTLPGLDCGACGSPSCKSLAEDIVREQAAETDCVFILRKRVGELAQELFDLSSKLPPPLDKVDLIQKEPLTPPPACPEREP